MTADIELEQYYALRAREYERIYAKPERQSDLRVLEECIPGLLAGKRVLEIACGTGYWTRFIAQRAREVIATDFNHEPLTVARTRGDSPKNAEFRIADAYDLPPSLGKFDGAFAGFWWSHLPQREIPRFLASLLQRLDPGARVVIVDNRFVEGSSTPIAETDEHGDTYQLRRLEDGSVHRILKNFPSENELRRVLAPWTSNLRFEALAYYWLVDFVAAT